MIAMATVLVSGILIHAPETTTLKNGEHCVTAIVESRESKYGNRTRIWHIAAVSETAQSALMQLCHGDTVIVQGIVKSGIHERNGEIALAVGVIAERVLNVPQRFAEAIAAARLEGQGEAQFREQQGIERVHAKFQSVRWWSRTQTLGLGWPTV
jgi:Single-strand binding protein family